MSDVTNSPHLPTEHEVTIRVARSMKLFERNGKLYYGKWRQWMRATPEEADRLLVEFREQTK